jgi:prepilin-type N-terminal cleavage/methylation domain-containing protein
MKASLLRRRLSGFTLLELLAVITVIGIVSAMVVPAFRGFGRSASLSASGNVVANMIDNARQTAMSKNTLTAVVVLGKQGTDEDFRAVTTLEFDPVAGWSQVQTWEVLPSGIVVDSADRDNCTFLNNSPQPFPFLTRGGLHTNPPVSYRGEPVKESAYAARIFLPTGSLQNPEMPARLRLVEGFVDGERVTYTRPDEKGKTANYYDVSIVGLTGLTKVNRP